VVPFDTARRGPDDAVVPLAVVLSLTGSVAVLAWLFARGRTRNVLLCVGAVFVFMAFGPLLNLIMGESAYEGIVQSELGPASIGFLSALLGLALADLVLPPRRSLPRPVPARKYELFPLLMMVLTGYTLLKIVTIGPSLLSVDKLERIELAGPWHYPYLLVETFAVALYFVALRTRFYRVLYWMNASTYVVYCLVTTERDFLFVGLAVLIHVQLFDTTVRTRRLVLLGTAGVALGALLAALREGLSFGLTQALNQGSIPFVDTFVRHLVPDYLPHLHGRTYLDGVLGVLPDALYSRDAPPLDAWLVDQYAAGSSGGYGFSLTAEAYLNFGAVGIPVQFFALGLLMRWVLNRADRSDWSTFLSVVMVTALFGALRGDTAQFVRILLYGAAFFAVLHLLSSRSDARPAAPEVVAVHAPPR
jgi:oligosaccharide repeat unit polymerase